MFYEERLSEDLTYLARGGREFNTTIVEQDNGYEYRNQNWSQTRGKWSISNGLLTQESIGTLGYFNLLNFFNAMRGRLHGFRFKDHQDYKATQNNGVLGTGFATGLTTYQLGKSYSIGSAKFISDIKKPVTGTLNIYDNGTLINPSYYTIDYTTGKVIFVSNIPLEGDVLTAEFEFDYPVRFDIDSLNSGMDEAGFISIDNISLVELRIK